MPRKLRQIRRRDNGRMEAINVKSRDVTDNKPGDIVVLGILQLRYLLGGNTTFLSEKGNSVGIRVSRPKGAVEHGAGKRSVELLKMDASENALIISNLRARVLH